MNIVWATRAFLDYRVPVYESLAALCGGNLTLLYCRDAVPERASAKARRCLGSHAVALEGEWVVGNKDFDRAFANRAIRIPFQPGLVRAILDAKPDVVISDGFFQWTYAALWARARHGIPHVMCYERTAHTERNAQWYRRWYRKAVLRWIDAICCTGSLCGEYVASLGFPPARITYGHMVADRNGLSAKTLPSAPPSLAARARAGWSRPVLLCVSRMIRAKGIRELLQAWNGHTQRHPSGCGTLLLVGDGPERAGLEQECRTAGLRNVHFAGAVDYDRIGAYYQAADLFIIPTLEDNWSLVVPEAMAFGLPVLCSQYNGCWPELVTEENGWVFDPLSPDSFAEVLGKAFASSHRWKQMGEQSRRVASVHTSDAAGASILRACEIAVGLHGRRPESRADSITPLNPVISRTREI